MLAAHKQGVVAEAAFCAAVVLAAWMLSGGAGFAQDRRPNILLIVADDAGYADIGSFGSEIQHAQYRCPGLGRRPLHAVRGRAPHARRPAR